MAQLGYVSIRAGGPGVETGVRGGICPPIFTHIEKRKYITNVPPKIFRPSTDLLRRMVTRRNGDT